MIDAQAMLFVYEIENELPNPLPNAPLSLIGVWNEENFSYVFFLKPEDSYIAELCSMVDVKLASRHDMKYCDWQEGFPEGGINICGLNFRPDNDSICQSNSIILDPSVVFGDGSHPTTVTCLEFMVEIIKTGKVKSILDLGTGSGILSLAAAKLGMERVVGIDKNLLAVKCAQKNVSLNAMEKIIEIFEGEARIFINDQYDLALANLPFNVLRDLAVLEAISGTRIWIVSGISRDQAVTLKALFVEQGFVITREKDISPWVSFVAADKNVWSELFNES